MNLLQRTKNKLIQNKLRNMKGIFVLQNAYLFFPRGKFVKQNENSDYLYIEPTISLIIKRSRS